MTFRFHETKKVLKTSILGGNGKVLKRDGFMIAAFTNTEGFNHVQAILLDGHDWNGDCCCSVNFVVASRYATERDYCVIVDQPHRHDGDLQGSPRS